jgi:hypothetical protein
MHYLHGQHWHGRGSARLHQTLKGAFGPFDGLVSAEMPFVA